MRIRKGSLTYNLLFWYQDNPPQEVYCVALPLYAMGSLLIAGLLVGVLALTWQLWAVIAGISLVFVLIWLVSGVVESLIGSVWAIAHPYLCKCKIE